MENNNNSINIIGGGFAGSEAALTLARLGYSVNLFEARPDTKVEPFNNIEEFAYPVCSNSFKTYDIENAHVLLKTELMCMGSRLLKIAHKCRIPAGKSLTVDRELFSKSVTEEIYSNKNIKVERRNVSPDELHGITIVASGPMSTSKITDFFKEKIGGEKFLYFYDAISPIISFESINMEKCFFGGRYDRGKDYINCPMLKEEYDAFYDALVNADLVSEKPHEKMNLFSGCMPVEEIAKTGYGALRFGVMKPVGFDRRYFAVVQMRRENREGTLYNIVGFQTKLKFGSQKEVVSMIPGLENAVIMRYGVMHRNFYIDSPRVLNEDFSMKSNDNIFLEGQITGSEGYVEAIMGGLYAAYAVDSKIKGRSMKMPSEKTMTGSLIRYITKNDEPIKPMNANFGLLAGYHKKRKKESAVNALIAASEWKKNND